MATQHKKVRVKGTDIEGTLAVNGGTHDFFQTTRNYNTPVAPVYFEQTGEVRYFDMAFLEDVEPVNAS